MPLPDDRLQPALYRRLRLSYGRVKLEKTLDPRDLKSLVDALIHAHQTESPAVLLPAYIRSYQRPNPG